MSGELDELNEQINRIIAKVWTKVEHPFWLLERQFYQAKTHYRELVKRRAHFSTLFALGNLFVM